MDRAELERRYKRLEVLASLGGGQVHLTEEDCNAMAEALRVSLAFRQLMAGEAIIPSGPFQLFHDHIGAPLNEARSAPPSGAVPLFYGRVGAPLNEAHIAPPPPPPAPSVPLVKGRTPAPPIDAGYDRFLRVVDFVIAALLGAILVAVVIGVSP